MLVVRSTDRGAREEVYNVRLADLLKEHGIISDPERIKRIGRETRLPDVVVTDILGIQTYLEGRVLEGNAIKKTLENDAKKRIREALCSVCVAVLYPKEIRECGTDEELKKFMRNSEKYLVKIFTQDSKSIPDWSSTDLKGLAAILRKTGESIISDEVLDEAQEKLEQALDKCEEAFIINAAVQDKLLEIIGVSPNTDGGSK